MNVLQSIADNRDDQTASIARDQDTAKGDIARNLANHDAAARLERFDRWLRNELATRIDWTWAGVHQERRIEQCRLHMNRLVLELWRRGWMLDGKRLAAHLIKCLDAVAAYQRKGGIEDFWAYFKSAVNRYVGANAEELSHEATRAGAHVNQLLASFGVKAAPAGLTIPELLAQRTDEETKAKTIREAQKAARRARKAAAADQTMPLL